MTSKPLNFRVLPAPKYRNIRVDPAKLAKDILAMPVRYQEGKTGNFKTFLQDFVPQYPSLQEAITTERLIAANFETKQNINLKDHMVMAGHLAKHLKNIASNTALPPNLISIEELNKRKFEVFYLAEQFIEICLNEMCRPEKSFFNADRPVQALPLPAFDHVDSHYESLVADLNKIKDALHKAYQSSPALRQSHNISR